MTPERWQQVRELFERVLAEAPHERSRLLADACEGDALLVKQVESLLAAHVAASGFLENSPVAPPSPELLIGRTLGRYQIQSALGIGGMGIVYRAFDTGLDRFVAIKVLPPEGSTESGRRRFVQEGKAASALNHPNIVTIHDAGSADDIDFIAMELVEGKTLAEFARRPLPPHEVLRYAIQIARALAAAHAAGIVHRDIKPGNIMVTADGLVKVLDFGLVTRAGADIDPTICGTVSYMSPEQAEGKPAGPPSDIFSFGSTCYELLTGHRAYSGSTHGEILNRLRNGEIPPMTPDIPERWQALLRRCLTTEIPHRIQTAQALLTELQSMEAGASAPPRIRPRTAWAIAAACVLLAALAATMLGRFLPTHRPTGPSEWVQLTKLPDSVSQPALSRDGRQIAFIRGPDTFAGAGQVYVKSLPSGEPAQLTRDSLQKMSPVFSPDGSQVAYTTINRENQWDTWMVPATGGEPRRWQANASGLVWAGQRRILFSEIQNHDVHMAIVTAADDRAGQHNVYVPPSDRGMAHRSYPSPDGRWALIVEMDPKAAWLPCRLVPMDGSSPGRQVGPPAAGCTSAAWSIDGRWMFLTSGVGGTFHIWRQRFPDGAPQQITSGPTEEEGIAIAPDGQSFITSVGLRQSPVWVRDATGERQVSLEGYSCDPRITPDGRRLLYRVVKGDSPISGPTELKVIDLDSGSSETLLPGLSLAGGLAGAYDLSRDGKEVVAVSVDPKGVPRLWLAPLDRSSPPRQIPNVQGSHPVFGPGGEIFFRSGDGASTFAYAVHPDGAGLRKVTDQPVGHIYNISPDGKWLVLRFLGANGATVTAYPLQGGGTFPISPPGSVGVNLKWFPDGQRILISVPSSMFWEHGGRTYVVPLPAGRMFPQIPPGGFQSERDVAQLPGAQRINAFDVAPGPTPDVYAYARETVQRNLYRIPIP